MPLDSSLVPTLGHYKEKYTYRYIPPPLVMTCFNQATSTQVLSQNVLTH